MARDGQCDARVTAPGVGGVWVATASGCAVFDGERFQPADPDAGGSDRVTLGPARSGGMWAVRGGKLLRYDAAGGRLETTEPAWLGGAGQINALHEDAGGALWIGTRNFGLLRYKGGKFERVPTSFGDISCLVEDGEGRLWAGTWGGGLNRLSPRHFFLRQIWQGRPRAALRSLCEDGEGRLWALGDESASLCVSDRDGRVFSPAPGWPAERRATVVGADEEGRVWVGTPQGLWQWREEGWRRTSLAESVVALSAGRGGVIWATTGSGGLFRGDAEGRFEPMGAVHEALALAEDAQGRLWAGDLHGRVLVREGGVFRPVPLPGAGGDETVRFLVPDGDAMWIGTLLGGIYRWKDGRVARVPAPADLSLAEVRSLLIERVRGAAERDVFWIGTATDLWRISRKDLVASLDGGGAELNLVRCGSNEGLPSLEFAPGSRNAAQTRDGRLWFATNRGLLEILPGAADQVASGARVLIEEASAGGVVFSPGSPDEAVFPPRPDAIRIRYTLPELGTPERVRFRYRLGDTGDGGRWIDAGSQREATLVRPEPGRYRLEVTATTGDGAWLSPSATMEFSVAPAWWQTGLFRAAVALVCAGAVAAGVRGIVMRRMRAKIHRIKLEHAVERERARIARDMHDELGANLTLIAAMSGMAAHEPEEGAKNLGEIETTARRTVEALDEIVWAVNPRHDTLAATVEYIGKFGAGFLAKAGIEAELVLPESIEHRALSAELRHHLFLAVKESLNNVVKHSGATSARLEIRTGAASVEIVVSDNGRGLDPGGADRFANGLVGMQERMAGVGGSCRVENRPEGGCRVVFELPLRGGETRGEGNSS